MKRKFLSILLTLAMALTLLPVSAMAEDAGGVECSETNCSHVAAIQNDNGPNSKWLHYNSLAEAIKKSMNNANVKLLADVEEDIVVPAHSNIYLNLNGHKITNKSSDTITVEKYGELSISGNGTVDNVTDGKAAIYNNGRVTLSGGSYTRSAEAENDIEHSGGNSYYNILNHGEMTIENGVSVTSSGHFSSLVANGYYDYTATDKGERTAYISNIGNAAPELTINGGTFSGGINTIKNDDNAKLVICGGSFSNVTQAVVQNNNVAEIHGGTFNAADHHAVENRHYNSNYNAGSVTITDGNFTGALYMTDGATWNITGGTFTDLANAVKYAADGATIKLADDVNGQVVIPTGKTITLDLNGHKVTAPTNDRYDAIINKGTLTVTDSKKTGEIYSGKNAGIGVGANSTTTIEYAKVTGQEGAIGGDKTVVGATVTIKDGVFTGIDNAVVIFNGTKREGAANEITINGGTFNGTIQSSGYVACGIYAPWKDNITVNGGTFNITGGAGIVARGGQVTVNGGVFNTTGNVTGKVGDSRVVVPCAALVFDSEAGYSGMSDDSKISVTGGNFKSDVDAVQVIQKEDDSNKRIAISGGYFTSDPTAYLANGKGLVTSDQNAFAYKVGDKATNVETAVTAGEAAVKIPDGVSDITEAAVKNAAKAADTTKTLTDTVAASGMTNDPAVVGTEEAAKAALSAKGISVNSSDTVTVVVQPYLEVNVKSADAGKLTLEISAKYNVVATTDELTTIAPDKTATLKSGVPLSINKPIELTIVLPTGFATGNSKIYVQHKGYEYTATVDASGATATFINPHGFSTFTVTPTASAVAEVDGTNYTDLQKAVDAVSNNGTVKLLNDTSASAVVSRAVKFTLDKNSKSFTGAITAGSGYKLSVDGDVYTFTVRSSSGSSGGSSSSSRRYDVSAPSVKHGDVTVSPKTASKGDTVTITVKPDSGYELDTLTVKDASGSKIKVKDKGDGKFTFTMPASKVTVSAEFAEIETLDFADVSTDAYYYEAVKWAAKKGITGGTGDGTFNPNGSCTRAHIVTFLWRAAGSPEPKSTVSFADVPAGSYYAKAVAWAVENGITLGTGDGTFSPNATCTRAQSVTFLYRALGTAPTTVNGFTDVTADAFYADAVAWAVESGVTNGTSASTFSPNNGCTRAQIVTFLYRTMK